MKSEKNYKKILVVRNKPKKTVYIREYPKDLISYKMGDIKAVSINKLRTWIAFANAAREARGEPLEKVIENIRRKMKTIKKPNYRQVLYLEQEDILNLKVQAINKGVSPSYVDILAKPKTKKKKYQEVLRI